MLKFLNSGQDTPFVSCPIVETRMKLREIVFQLKETGQTALGQYNFMISIKIYDIIARSRLTDCVWYGFSIVVVQGLVFF